MRFHFNRRPTDGPWGGGSKILRSIVEESTVRGHVVSFERDVPSGDYDVLFVVDPREKDGIHPWELIKHARAGGAKIVQRVGDVGTHGKPDLLGKVLETLRTVDLIIYPSVWSIEYVHASLRWKTDTQTSVIVIPNAPDEKFIAANRCPRDFRRNTPVRVVTHHWSDNPMKGFDDYVEFDSMCTESKFTFIGRKPPGCSLKNSVGPMGIDDLCIELPKHDVYLTSSRLEAGANHVLEAMAIGLPVIHIGDGGSIVEYCRSRGIHCPDVRSAFETVTHRKDDLYGISTSMTPSGGNPLILSSRHTARRYVDEFEWLVTS